MKNPIPIQFLVGLTRLISIYYCVCAIDQFFGAILKYKMMKSSGYDIYIEMPSHLLIYSIGLLTYIAIAVCVWFLAPFVCRIAIQHKAIEESSPESNLCWNEVMIFLVGTLFVGIGITRLSSIFLSVYNARIYWDAIGGYRFGLADMTNAVTTIILIGFGVIFMTKFSRIYRWIQNKSTLIQ